MPCLCLPLFRPHFYYPFLSCHELVQHCPPAVVTAVGFENEWERVIWCIQVYACLHLSFQLVKSFAVVFGEAPFRFGARQRIKNRRRAVRFPIIFEKGGELVENSHNGFEFRAVLGVDHVFDRVDVAHGRFDFPLVNGQAKELFLLVADTDFQRVECDTRFPTHDQEVLKHLD